MLADGFRKLQRVQMPPGGEVHHPDAAFRFHILARALLQGQAGEGVVARQREAHQRGPARERQAARQASEQGDFLHHPRRGVHFVQRIHGEVQQHQPPLMQPRRMRHGQGHDALWVMQAAWSIGGVMAHDVGVLADGRPVFVNTAFSCLATVDEGTSFRPIWQPPFISELAVGDRCHIREFGFTNPILVDGERGVIAGHGRLLAARQLGMDTVPTLELAHLAPSQRRAYVLGDNRLALSAGWDAEMLRLELGELQFEGFDLGLTGFEADEIAGFLAEPTSGLTDPDDVPPVPETPGSRLGDVWILGRHHLVCGDSTDAGAVAAALGGVRPHLMVTDPPYGVNYEPRWRNAALAAAARPG